MTISTNIQLTILSPIPGRIAEGIRKAQDDLVSARNPQLGKVRAELVDAIAHWIAKTPSGRRNGIVAS